MLGLRTATPSSATRRVGEKLSCYLSRWPAIKPMVEVAGQSLLGAEGCAG